jgi:hypothetical protein
MLNRLHVTLHHSAPVSGNHTELDAKSVHSTAEHTCCETRNQNLPAIQERTRFCLRLFESTMGDADTLLLLGQCIP